VKPTALPPLSTRVGHAGWGDNQFCGRSVLRDLAGRASWIDLLALALGRQPLRPDDNQLLEDVAASAMAADPRIWPLKIARLASSYGGTLIPLSAAHAWFEGAPNSPWTAGACAELLVGLAVELGERVDEPAALQQALTRRGLDAGKLPGFGIAVRPEDERVVAVAESRRRRGHPPGKFFRLAESVAAMLQPPRPLNIYGAFAAVSLDLGFAPEQIGTLTTVLISVSVVANVVEGAAQAPPVLQRLPNDRVLYQGPERRPSPRALSTRRA